MFAVENFSHLIGKTLIAVHGAMTPNEPSPIEFEFSLSDSSFLKVCLGHLAVELYDFPIVEDDIIPVRRRLVEVPAVGRRLERLGEIAPSAYGPRAVVLDLEGIHLVVKVHDQEPGIVLEQGHVDSNVIWGPAPP